MAATASTPLDVDALRGRFPALARTGPDGRPLVYLDGAAGSQVPRAVIDAMVAYLERSNANCGGAFPTSIESDAVLEEARRAAGDLLGAAPEEIAFGANTTSLQFQLVHSLLRTCAPGDEIVTTELDHDSNVAPWLRVAEDHGLVVRQARLRPADGTLDMEHLASLVGPRTKVVAFTLAANSVGTIPDARAIVELAHGVGALAWADAVHYAPHRRMDRRGMGIDVLFSSPYKYFGPHLGVAAIRADLAASLPADRVRPASEEPAGHRFETGTQSHESIAGFLAGVGYLESLGDGATRSARLDDAFARIRTYEDALSRRTLEALAELPHVELYGLADPARVAERTATYCLRVRGQSPRETAERLAAQGILVWDGNYYALSTMVALGLEETGGAVRAGYLHYTTAAEVDRFLEALRSLG